MKIECACHDATHGLVVDSFGSTDLYVSMAIDATRWRDRLRIAWQILRGKTVEYNGCSTEKDRNN